jgi:putative aminopeptidase FrvX
MYKKYESYILGQFEKLLDIPSVTGYFREIEDYLCAEASKLGYSPIRYRKGGLIFCLGGEGNPIMLTAHADTIGAMVQCVKSDGRLKITPVGGLNPSNVETENVKVITRFGGRYDGTIQIENASSHVNRKLAETKRSFEENIEVVLDAPVKSGEDVTGLGISAGDYVVLNHRLTITESGYIKSRFIDDKICVALLLGFAKNVKEESLKLRRKTYVAFTVYEEVLHGGASGIPDDAEEILGLDMGCVGENLKCTETMAAIVAKDAYGPYNYDIVTRLATLAKERQLDFAIDTYTGYVSDVSVAMRAGYDVRHALIGPGVYASHGYERTHKDGLRNTYELLSAYMT